MSTHNKYFHTKIRNKLSFLCDKLVLLSSVYYMLSWSMLRLILANLIKLCFPHICQEFSTSICLEIITPRGNYKAQESKYF